MNERVVLARAKAERGINTFSGSIPHGGPIMEAHRLPSKFMGKILKKKLFSPKLKILMRLSLIHYLPSGHLLNSILPLYLKSQSNYGMFR
jgi:hypothetical protein